MLTGEFIRSRQIAFFLCLLACSAPAFAADWQATVTKEPGKFPELRPLRARYNFGWSGFTAAVGDIHFTKPSADRFQLEGNGRTIGLVRALWKFDVSYRSLADARTLRPVEANQTETVKNKKVTTHLMFSNAGVTRSRSESPAKGGAGKPRQFNLPGMFDLQSVMLFLRSQSLKDRASYRVVVYPTTAAYLATVTVTGREKVSVRAGNYNAIKLDLQLNKIGKNLELEPHRKFKRATVWISDDAERIVLRTEAQIFVGTVFAELQSMQVDAASKP
jgi:hypothetical protein